MSMTASGTIANALVFASWKGIAYVRGYQKPSNPNTPKQVNQKLAFKLIVAYWQTLDAPAKAVWDLFASGTGKSGFNQFTERGLKAYAEQFTTDDTMASVTVTGDAPTDVWVWVIVI